MSTKGVCNTPVSVSGSVSGHRAPFQSVSGSKAAAIKAAEDSVPRRAEAEAWRAVECPSGCKHKTVDIVTIDITRSYTISDTPGLLLMSLWYWEWQYEGVVDFTWTATVTCDQP